MNPPSIGQSPTHSTVFKEADWKTSATSGKAAAQASQLSQILASSPRRSLASHLRSQFMKSNASQEAQTEKLVEAIQARDEQGIRDSLANGASLDKAIHHRINDAQTVQRLLQLGGNPNRKYKGLTPADRADQHKNAETLAVLRNHRGFRPEKIVDRHLRGIMQQSVWSQARAARENPAADSVWQDPDSVDPLERVPTGAA